MSKQINIQTRPGRGKEIEADRWVKKAQKADTATSEKTKRLTVDIDADLHRRLRLHSVQNDVPIANLVRQLIGQHLEQTSQDLNGL
ncbi:hypothetical protein [Rhodopirellula bahusiensis]|uniref:hypothetical protein n=1 Tax=Rhodopirellula bahusiensis TaxID=2014065 RepID=UPI003266E0EA